MKLRALALVAVVLTHGAGAGAQQLSLTMRDGIVTLDARAVPVPQILREWARVGNVEVINGDKVLGPPITVQLTGVTEREALDVILSGVSGYVLGSGAAAAGVAVFHRIVILPTSSTARPVAMPAPARAARRPDGGTIVPVTELEDSPGLAEAGTMPPPPPGPVVPFVPPASGDPAVPFAPPPSGQAATVPPGQPAPVSTPGARNPFFTGPVGSGQPGSVTPLPPPPPVRTTSPPPVTNPQAQSGWQPSDTSSGGGPPPQTSPAR